MLKGYFFLALLFTVTQRFYELRIAKRNVASLEKKGAVEFGADHYRVMVALHASFFGAMIVEYLLREPTPPVYWPFALLLFLIAQAGRIWVMRTLRGRWTTRILVLPGERLVSTGPFRYLSHPNYLVVAVELLTLPLVFGLYGTSILFTVLNAWVLLKIRLPIEQRALNWSQQFTRPESGSFPFLELERSEVERREALRSLHN